MTRIIVLTLSAVFSATTVAQGPLAISGEKHLSNINQLTFGGENADAYF